MPVVRDLPKACPRCGKSAIRRSHRRPLERPLKLIRLLPYRCDACDLRFYRFGKQSADKPQDPSPSQSNVDR
jgi:hypothetical protein